MPPSPTTLTHLPFSPDLTYLASDSDSSQHTESAQQAHEDSHPAKSSASSAMDNNSHSNKKKKRKSISNVLPINHHKQLAAKKKKKANSINHTATRLAPSQSAAAASNATSSPLVIKNFYPRFLPSGFPASDKTRLKELILMSPTTMEIISSKKLEHWDNVTHILVRDSDTRTGKVLFGLAKMIPVVKIDDVELVESLVNEKGNENDFEYKQVKKWRIQPQREHLFQDLSIGFILKKGSKRLTIMPQLWKSIVESMGGNFMHFNSWSKLERGCAQCDIIVTPQDLIGTLSRKKRAPLSKCRIATIDESILSDVIEQVNFMPVRDEAPFLVSEEVLSAHEEFIQELNEAVESIKEEEVGSSNTEAPSVHPANQDDSPASPEPSHPTITASEQSPNQRAVSAEINQRTEPLERNEKNSKPHDSSPTQRKPPALTEPIEDFSTSSDEDKDVPSKHQNPLASGLAHDSEPAGQETTQISDLPSNLVDDTPSHDERTENEEITQTASTNVVTIVQQPESSSLVFTREASSSDVEFNIRSPPLSESSSDSSSDGESQLSVEYPTQAPTQEMNQLADPVSVSQEITFNVAPTDNGERSNTDKEGVDGRSPHKDERLMKSPSTKKPSLAPISTAASRTKSNGSGVRTTARITHTRAQVEAIDSESDSDDNVMEVPMQDDLSEISSVDSNIQRKHSVQKISTSRAVHQRSNRRINRDSLQKRQMRAAFRRNLNRLCPLNANNIEQLVYQSTLNNGNYETEMKKKLDLIANKPALKKKLFSRQSEDMLAQLLKVKKEKKRKRSMAFKKESVSSKKSSSQNGKSVKGSSKKRRLYNPHQEEMSQFGSPI